MGIYVPISPIFVKETKIETIEIPEAVVNALDDALEEFEKIKRSISVESTANEQPLLKPSKSITMTFSELNQVTGEPLTLTITADAPKNRSKTRRRSKKGKKSKSKPLAADEDELQLEEAVELAKNTDDSDRHFL